MDSEEIEKSVAHATARGALVSVAAFIVMGYHSSSFEYATAFILLFLIAVHWILKPILSITGMNIAKIIEHRKEKRVAILCDIGILIAVAIALIVIPK